MAGLNSTISNAGISGRPAGVSVTGLSKAYGELQALDSFSVEFPAGKCTILLGPSGCGKTTVLRSIAGLITPDSGRIAFGDTVVFDVASGINVPPERRHLGMVFQSYALWPHLTIGENIAYPLARSGLSRAAIRDKADAMLSWVGLKGMGGRYVHELSGGQQQRVSLGRAMIGQPRAVLFDEPLSNLDARLRERMRIELLTLRQREPFTSIYVTHDQLEAMTLGDQVVVMRAGHIEQVGTPEDVYKRPQTRFSADFMGIPNLLEGVVRAIEGDVVAVDTVIGTLSTRTGRRGWSPGARCTVAVRSTLIHCSPPANGATGRGRVLRSMFQGTSTVHLVEMEGAVVTVESLADTRHQEGAAVDIAPVHGAVFALLND